MNKHNLCVCVWHNVENLLSFDIDSIYRLKMSTIIGIPLCLNVTSISIPITSVNKGSYRVMGSHALSNIQKQPQYKEEKRRPNWQLFSEIRKRKKGLKTYKWISKMFDMTCTKSIISVNFASPFSLSTNFAMFVANYFSCYQHVCVCVPSVPWCKTDTNTAFSSNFNGQIDIRSRYTFAREHITKLM